MKDAEFYVPKENPGRGSSLFMLGMSQILQLIDARIKLLHLDVIDNVNCSFVRN